MSKAKIALPIMVAVVGFALSGVVATSKPSPQPRALPTPAPAEVDVIERQPFSDRVMLKSQGVVRPRHQIDLVAQVGGVVQSVADAFETGGQVDANAVLLQIDPRDYEVAVARAKASLADAQQRLATEKGQAKQARQQWSDLGDEEANDLFLRKPQLASAQAQVEAARADLRQARLNLQRSTVRAPFAGRIVEVKANLGQYVAAGAAVASLYSSQAAEVALPLTGSQQAMLDHQAIRQGQPVRLSAARGRERADWQALLTRLGAQIDDQTRTLDAIVEVREPFAASPVLQMGDFVQADIPSRLLDGLIRLPADALRAGNTIWTVDDNGKLKAVAVRVLQRNGDKLIIQLPTPQSVQIVTSYLANATDGLSVRTLGAAETSQ